MAHIRSLGREKKQITLGDDDDEVLQSPASDRVFSTPELVEQILLHLPPRILLVTALRISRSFNTLISTSPALQQALFFRAVPSSPSHSCCWIYPTSDDLTKADHHDEDGGEYLHEPNPILQDLFPPFFAFLPPYSSPLPDPGELHVDNPRCSFHGKLDLLALPWNVSCASRQAYARADASWRRMLVTQPPVQRLEIVMCADMRGGQWFERGDAVFPFDDVGRAPTATEKVACEDGLRMGTLYDLVVQHGVRSRRLYWSFAVDWSSAASFGDAETPAFCGDAVDVGDEVVDTMRGEQWGASTGGKPLCGLTLVLQHTVQCNRRSRSPQWGTQFVSQGPEMMLTRNISFHKFVPQIPPGPGRKWLWHFLDDEYEDRVAAAVQRNMDQFLMG